MEQVAKIALEAAPYAADKPYDYKIPDALADRAVPGVRVVVPFGAGNRHTEGLILSIGPGEEGRRQKSILFLLDEAPVLSEKGLKLALWMREQYFCTAYDAARAMLPAGLWFSLKDEYRIAEGVDREAAFAAAGRSQRCSEVLELIYRHGGAAELDQIRAAFAPKDPNPALRQLTEQGIVTLEPWARRHVKDKTEQTALLALPPEEALALVTPKRASAPLRYAVVELLAAVGAAGTKEICYFTGASPATLKSLAKSGILTLARKEVYRRVAIESTAPAETLTLNGEQQAAFEGLDALCRAAEPAAALLRGVTGSGKTRIYIRLIEQTLKRGKSAMVLVPEIALTPQMLHLFTAHFGDLVAVLHSSLRTGERYDEWKRVKAGEARVVVGTRSAVFAPADALGLIVLDEEHEGSYKSENAPRYHAREVAKYRCVQEGALLLLGSATPSIETMQAARAGTYHHFALTRRYNERSLPEVLIADMRKELRAGNGGSISALLRGELEQNIARGEQSILFINRRGTSRMISCGECGTVPDCPRCSVHLTYHAANGRLMCHYCGHSCPLPGRCPDCGGEFHFIGMGTQKVEQELGDLFPGVEVLRMDADTVSPSRSHEALLGRFQNKKIPILVGTQMVAKGLDFEQVTLVGVLAADLSLYLDHFGAAERTFSLLTQVVGRAGRGDKLGRAVIQTFTPENEVIRFAAQQDYDAFFEEELALRQLRGFPPFTDQFLITASGVDEISTLRTCMKLRTSLDDWFRQPEYQALDARLLGPAPAPVVKVKGRYRYRLTLLCRNTRQIRTLLAHLARTAQADRQNHGVLVFIDVNPLN